MVPELITSLSNPKIRELLGLQEKSRSRRELGLFVVEGRREVQRCIAAGFIPRTIFLCPELYAKSVSPSPRAAGQPAGPSSRGGHLSGEAVKPVLRPAGGAGILTETKYGSKEPRGFRGSAPDNKEVKREGPSRQAGRDEDEVRSFPGMGLEAGKIIEVSRDVYERVAYRGSTEGVIAEVFYRERKIEDLRLPENPLVMVLESVEKPGNLGAVLRSADAAGADAVIICDPATDIYNPNLIRSSLGAVFTVPVVAASSEEAAGWLKRSGVRIFTAQLQDSSPYYDVDMKGGTALVMGTESTGLTQTWRRAADRHIRIPMLGKLDSLNVSVSAAILLFEAVRQRQGSE